MKIPNPISRLATCFSQKTLCKLVLVNIFLVGFASTEVHANGLTVSPATISETYEPYATNEKLLTLTNKTDASIDYTIKFKTSKNGSSDWLTISQESGTLDSSSSTDLTLTIKVSEAFPFDRQTGEVYIEYITDGISSQIVVPVEVVASDTLWDTDKDHYPDIFENQFGSDPQNPESSPTHSENQMSENKYYLVDDDFAEEDMSAYKTRTIQAAIDAVSSTVDEYADEANDPYAIIEVYIV